ncbi:glutaredoxin 2 [Dickeya dianthicola]|uniref:glutaredoxin 2 n=1 Tax=Dickeya dianthicola TaxID=204039 RepID=UPI00136DD282|nr:glutaredoxin 2 [Dickeya dianthicola]MCI4238702.1 glutaredoxin 2 [Dickeya dianthicola]MCI4254426.1 glutaredoxin 2 [Dickeya dianthicola]MZG22469.1 glutaredoxin 2 [Dickeya dianthicola]MZI88120.1 glutaredoxin 2 [Dickeya dianthicola]
MKLFVYDHCPFCVKARMIFGLKRLPVELHVLSNDDEATPISMVGQKMVPILQKQDGSYMPESLDIVKYIDELDGKPVLTGPLNPAIDAWIRRVYEYASRLLIPRFSRAAFEEFATDAGRNYFIHKKEGQIGSFDTHFSQTAVLIGQLEGDLQALAPLIVSPQACNGTLSLDDINLFALLRSLTIVADVNVPAAVAAYCDTLSQNANVELLIEQAQ